ncbi:MAG: DUF2442 domain-containing protein [Proteobacteria bacterium]|nr:DUF2442 domain-containing protein [Pseudomonadota bacterium]
MLGVQQAEYLSGYKIRIMFNNGLTGTANLEQSILNDRRAIFVKLKDEHIFRDFKLAHSTIVWFDELDLAPEYLFYLAFMEEVEFQGQFRQWGYTAS